MKHILILALLSLVACAPKTWTYVTVPSSDYPQQTIEIITKLDSAVIIQSSAGSIYTFQGQWTKYNGVFIFSGHDILPTRPMSILLNKDKGFIIWPDESLQHLTDGH